MFQKLYDGVCTVAFHKLTVLEMEGFGTTELLHSLLTSPEPSSVVQVWISSPQSHNHYVGPVLPTADEQYLALPVKHQIKCSGFYNEIKA